MSLVIAAISYRSRSRLHNASISEVLPEPTGPPTPTRSGPWGLRMRSNLIARHARACRGHRARASAFYPGGASPHQVNLLRPVANRNCVVMRGGGGHRKGQWPPLVKENRIVAD